MKPMKSMQSLPKKPSLAPLAAQGEEEWQRLEKQLEWTNGFWLGVVFTASPSMARSLRNRSRQKLGQLGKSFHLFLQPSPDDLGEEAPKILLGADTPAADCIWLETAAVDPPLPVDDDPGPWTSAWENLLLRLNEHRDRLRRRLHGGLVLVMPPSLKTRFHRAAPDLWSIRSLVLEPTVILEWLREAEGFLLVDQPGEAIVLARHALDAAETMEAGGPKLVWISKGLVILARAEAATDDPRAAIRHLQEAVDLRAGQPLDREILQWYELWFDFVRATSDPLELRKALESAARHSSREGSSMLAKELERLYEERAALEDEGQNLEGINKKIVGIKRWLREGGHLKEGDCLGDGRYQLQAILGQGGFAQVWKAYDQERQELVAAKVLHAQYARDKTRHERFFRGARQMARLRHPGIVEVLEEKLEDGGYHFFVMEYLAGGDFRRAVIGEKLSPDERLEIILQIGEALAFAHARGVVHRDVKPSNILLDLDERPKLTDFDLVRAADTTGGTRTSMLGTFLYAAPEAMMGGKTAAEPADVYSLGMTALFALHGADLPPDVLWELPEFLDGLDVSDALRKALRRAVARKIEQRWPSIGEFCNALDKARDPGP